MCRRLLKIAPRILLIPTLAAHAEVTLDGTLGPAGSLSGPDYGITADLGQQVGTNLFHSFGRFDLAPGESATFSGPASVTDVIGRVTGGESSSIDGTLRSTIPGADLYLVNPAGILFGPNARLDLDGSFHAATAHHLRLEDGGRFDAMTPETSSLSAAPVAAFGFLDQDPAPLTVDGARLRVLQGEGITLVGGDVRISDGTLFAPGGRIGVAAAGAGGEALIQDDGLAVDGAGGAIEISNSDGEYPEFDGYTAADLDVSAEGGGRIAVVGEQILIQGAEVYADSRGAGDAGGVTVEAQGAVELRDGATIASWCFGAGDAGALEVTAGELSIDGTGSEYSTGISSEASTGSSGDAGSIEVTVAGAASIITNGAIRSNTSGTGDAGSVEVKAGELSIDGSTSGLFTGIGSNTLRGSTGSGGAVEVSTAGAVSILAGGSIGTGAAGTGDAGSVKVTAGSLLIDGQGQEHYTGIDSTTGSPARAGAIDVTITGAGSILAGGMISSSTLGAGDAGSVRVTADSLEIDGQGEVMYTGIDSSTYSSGDAGVVEVEIADVGSIRRGGAVGSSALGEGDAGLVKVTAGSLTIDRAGGEIWTGIDSSTYSSGEGGAVEVTVTDTASILAGGMISSDATGTGDGGSVKVTAGSLQIDAQGLGIYTGIDSSAAFSGNAGTVEVTIADSGSILGGGGISSNTYSSGDAGSVVVTANSLSIAGPDDLSWIATLTSGGGDAGRIAVQAENLMLGENGMITSTSQGLGKAGDIDLAITEKLQVQAGGGVTAESLYTTGGNIRVTAASTQVTQGGVISSSVYGSQESDGGNVSVDGANLVLLDGGVITATANQGLGGNILIDTEVFLHDGSSLDRVLNASSGTAGNDGTVDVNSPELDIGGSLVALPGSFLDAGGELGHGCDAARAGRRSSLLVTGRDVLYLSPDE